MPKRLPDPRGRILDSALVLFARFGLEGTTLSTVAKRAHLAKTTLYHHFPGGKTSIFHAAVARTLAGHWDAFETEVRAQRDPLHRLACYSRLRIRTFDREMARWGLSQRVWDGMKPAANEVMKPYYAREFALLTEIVATGIASGQLRAGSAGTIARLLQAAFRGLTLDGPLDISPRERDAELRELAEFVAGGLVLQDSRDAWLAAIAATDPESTDP